MKQNVFFSTLQGSDHESPHDGTTHRVDWKKGTVTVWFDRWATEPEDKAGEYRLDLSEVGPPDFVPWNFCHDCERFFAPGENRRHDHCDTSGPVDGRPDQLEGLMA